MATISIDEYQAAMRENICAVCVSFVAEQTDPRRCVYENSGQCSLFAHLPEVVEAISRVKSNFLEDYEKVLRQTVCAHCDHLDSRGVCNLRDSRGPLPDWCILDTYFNLIVGAVEDVQQAHTS